MKIKQKFKDVQKPKDIDPKDLNKYFSGLYKDDHIDVEKTAYSSDTTEELIGKRKQQVNTLVDNLVKLSGNQKFESLRAQLLADVSDAKDARTHDAMRRTAEAICYKLAKGLIYSKQKFNDEVNSFTIDACSPGAVTNLQKALYTMDDSLYVQKYDYIQNLANSYIRDNKLNFHRGREYIADEAHNANMLIHEVSRDYHVTPPYDSNAVYRSLDAKPTEAYSKYVAFKGYLDRHLNSRQGIYSLINHLTSNYLSNLPAPQNFSGTGREANEIRDRIAEVAQECSLSMDDILNHSEDYTQTNYKPNYLSLLKAGMMQKMANEGIIEPNFLTIDGKQIIESPDSWVQYDPATKEYRELFSTKELDGFTIGNKNIEEVLHEHLKTQKPSDASRFIAELTTKNLLLLSDQLTILKEFMPIEEIDSLSIHQTREWLELCKYKHNDSEALTYIAKFGDIEKLDKYLRMKGKSYQDLEDIKDINGNSLLHLAIENSNQKIADHLISNSINLNSQNKQKNTPLHISINKGDITTFKKLIAAGTNQSLANSNGLNPLQLASNQNIDFFQKVLDCGVELEATNKQWQTTLQYTIETNDFEKTRILVQKGADINATDIEGYSALHYAVRNAENIDNTRAIKLLLEASTDSNLRNQDPQTFINYAKDYCSPKIFDRINKIYQEHLKKLKPKDLKPDLTDSTTEKPIQSDEPSRSSVVDETIGTDRHSLVDEIVKTPSPQTGDLEKERALLNSLDNTDRYRTSSDASTASISSTSIFEFDSVIDEFESKKEQFIKKLDKKYVFRNIHVKKKALEYINSAKLHKGEIKSDDYQDYAQGKARKGKSQKFAELLSGVRNTDNQMVQEITEQFKQFATQDTHQVSLPKRYAKTKTTRSQ